MTKGCVRCIRHSGTTEQDVGTYVTMKTRCAGTLQIPGHKRRGIGKGGLCAVT